MGAWRLLRAVLASCSAKCDADVEDQADVVLRLGADRDRGTNGSEGRRRPRGLDAILTALRRMTEKKSRAKEMEDVARPQRHAYIRLPVTRSAGDDRNVDDDVEAEEDEPEDPFYLDCAFNACSVCERAFFTLGQLHRHQMKLRHFGCEICWARFRSSILLEYHKDAAGHWCDADRPFGPGDDVVDARRECMDDLVRIDPEFDSDQEDREKLL